VSDKPGRGELALGPAHSYDWVDGHPDFVQAVREENLESVKPPEQPRPFDAVPRDLITHEQQVKLLPSPRRLRWKEIAKYDQRIAEVDRHQRELSEEAQRVAEELRVAPERDGDKLSTWQLTGRKGPKPESTVPALERQLADLHGAVEGMNRRRGEILDEKRQYVEKHRSKLLAECGKAAGRARERYEQTIADAEAARRELEEVRSASLWCGLFPDVAPHQYEVPKGVAGNLRRPLTEAGINGPVEPDKLFKLLSEDAAWLEHAADAEQKALLEGRDPRTGRAVWTNTEEGQEWQREQQRQARERYRQDWGQDMPEFVG
jgi:hypothetical protein